MLWCNVNPSDATSDKGSVFKLCFCCHGFISWCHDSGNWLSWNACVRWHFITKSDIHRLDFRLSRLGRDVTITYAYQRLEHTHTHTHTKRDPASQSNSLIFLLLCWSFHHNKAPLLCWPLCIVFENGWHTQIQPHRLYRPSSLRLVMLKHIEVGSLSRMN